MTLPLMPKATAVWLIENTALSFKQIGDFCGMHELEIQSIADGDVAIGVVGHDPVISGQLSKEEIARCEKDGNLRLKISVDIEKLVKQKKKGGKYTPVARRQDKPDAISWILRNHPEISDNRIIKLIGTTKNTINSVRSKEHWNSTNIRPRDPVILGLCTQVELNKAVEDSKTKADINEDQQADLI
jgi:hypothetical protein